MKRSVLVELAWILPTVAIPIGMLVAIVVAAFGMSIHVPTNTGVIQAATFDRTLPIDRPGVILVAPGHYQVVLISQAGSFLPNEIRVPAGSTVDFIATSRDDGRGLRIEGTNVEVMLSLGQVANVREQFNRPGEYPLVCHQRCGVGRQGTGGKVIVEE